MNSSRATSTNLFGRFQATATDAQTQEIVRSKATTPQGRVEINAELDWRQRELNEMEQEISASSSYLAQVHKYMTHLEGQLDSL